MSDVKVVIPYYGGKHKLSRELVPMIPPHKHYFEAFAGGLSMFFRKTKAEWNCVNDLNKDITNLYMVLGDEYLFNKLSRKVYYAVKSRTYYDQIKDKIQTNPNFYVPDVDRAFEYYFYIRNSFNSQMNSGFNIDIGGWTTALQESLTFGREKMNGVVVENMDYKDLIIKYAEKENSFWYFDPPYTMAEEMGYYRINFDDVEHMLFHDKVTKLAQHKSTPRIMISYDDSEWVRNKYKNWIIKEITTTYAGNLNDPNKKFVELVILNYIPKKKEIGLFDAK